VLVLISIENIPHLTQTGLVELSPAQQVIQLFNSMALVTQVLIVACGIGGWLFGLVVLLFRKFLKIKPAPVAHDAENTPAPV
jgi:hypothetical protein